MGFRAAGEEPEGVAVEIDFSGREEKFGAETAERIGGVEGGGFSEHGTEAHAEGVESAKEKMDRGFRQQNDTRDATLA